MGETILREGEGFIRKTDYKIRAKARVISQVGHSFEPKYHLDVVSVIPSGALACPHSATCTTDAILFTGT